VSRSTASAVVVVAGFGSEHRHDDGVGPLVAARVAAERARVRDVGPLSDPLDLLGQWNDADLVIVIDAVRSAAPIGTIHVLEMDVTSPPGDIAASQPGVDRGVASTHGIGLAGVVRLAKAIGQAPHRLVVVGIEGEAFGFGQGLTMAVEAAIPEAVDRVLRLIGEPELCA
jgi:hydrogenase maturation protease